MPSAIWSGNIGFGLVSVPVKVVSATRSQDVRFNQLEEGTGARIRYRKVGVWLGVLPAAPFYSRAVKGRRAGQECLVCGSTVKTRILEGRNLFWCPTCQRRR